MTLIGVVFVLIVCVLIPVMAIRTARQIEARRLRPTPAEILLSTLVTHGPLAALAVLTAYKSGIVVFPAPSFRAIDAIAGTALLVLATLANVCRWGVLDESERRRNSWMRPQRASDLWAWLGVSLIAGFSEELVYRGVLLGLFLPLFGGASGESAPGVAGVGGYWLAAGVCVVAFTLGHWVQGRGAMLIVVVFAVAFHVLVRITGDLYTAMIVHAAYDFVAGLLLWWLARGRRETVLPAS